jgi:hypothetical protein
MNNNKLSYIPGFENNKKIKELILEVKDNLIENID